MEGKLMVKKAFGSKIHIIQFKGKTQKLDSKTQELKQKTRSFDKFTCSSGPINPSKFEY